MHGVLMPAYPQTIPERILLLSGEITHTSLVRVALDRPPTAPLSSLVGNGFHQWDATQCSC